MENIELKSGDILHCYRNTLLSRIICKFTKSKYSHSALVIENWGELFVAGSQYNGTKLRKLKDWKKKCENGKWIDI